MTYERGLTILAGLNDVKQPKTLLKDNMEDLNSETKFLFGETFQKHVKTTAKAQKSAEKMLAKAGKKNGKLAVTGPIYQASPQVNHARQWEGPLASNEVVAVAGIKEVRMIPKHFPMSPAGDSQWGIESLVHAHPKLRDRFPKIKKKINPQHSAGRLKFFWKTGKH